MTGPNSALPSPLPVNTPTLAAQTLALPAAEPLGGLLAAAPLWVAALLLGQALSLALFAVRHETVAAPALALAGGAWALHLAWTPGLTSPALEELRWALLLALPPAFAALWRAAGSGVVRVAVVAVALVACAAWVHDLQAVWTSPRWMAWAGLAFAALAWMGWRQQLRAARARVAAAAEEGCQRMREQAAELAATRVQVQQAVEAAEAAAQARSSFLAAASHDLRQPAHALGLYTAALRAGPLAPAQAEIVSRMQASLSALDGLFAALLDVSRIDAGAVVPQWDTVPLAPLLHRLALEWAPQAEARGLRLAVHVADPLAVTVTDALLLERALRNLLSNAVKYTAQGGVLLACRARTAGDGGVGWRVEVWDTGVGIAPSERERVFEEFYQVPSPGRERGQGLGLGLAIVQRLVRLLHLRLVVHSVPGRGSAFLLSGLAMAGPATRRAAVARQAMRQLQGLGVAVLEDDADVRDAMRRLLGLWGCQVLEGSDARDLLRQDAHGTGVHALVADVHLAQGRQGPDEARRLAEAWGRELPVLLISGETGEPALQALQEAGHRVWPKPVSPARLRTWLEGVAASRPGAWPRDEESLP